MHMESERERLARTPDNTDTRPLPQIISDMECFLGDLVCWGAVIRALDASAIDIEPGALNVVGRAIQAAAIAAEKDWQRAADLTRATGGAS